MASEDLRSPLQRSMWDSFEDTPRLSLSPTLGAGRKRSAGEAHISGHGDDASPQDEDGNLVSKYRAPTKVHSTSNSVDQAHAAPQPQRSFVSATGSGETSTSPGLQTADNHERALQTTAVDFVEPRSNEIPRSVNSMANPTSFSDDHLELALVAQGSRQYELTRTGASLEKAGKEVEKLEKMHTEQLKSNIAARNRCRDIAKNLPHEDLLRHIAFRGPTDPIVDLLVRDDEGRAMIKRLSCDIPRSAFFECMLEKVSLEDAQKLAEENLWSAFIDNLIEAATVATVAAVNTVNFL